MKKIIVVFLISFISAFSNENVVKTSELELFLFKVGFESLLKDVKVTKDKSTLNEQELLKINEKIDLIMNEIYKNKRVLLNDSETSTQKLENEEFENLKKEVEFLKQEISKLKEKKQITPTQKEKSLSSDINTPIKPKEKNDSKMMKVASDFINLYQKTNSSSKVIKSIKRDTVLEIKWCDSFGWCKLQDNSGYVRKFLLKPYE